MNRSQPLVLILALLPCAALLAGCPEEKKSDPADSGTHALPSTTPTATPSATAVAVPTTTAPATVDAGPALDAGAAVDAGKDASKPAPKK